MRYCRSSAHVCLGINFAYAKLLIENGCNVLIADLALRPEAKALVETYSTGSPRAIFQQTDVCEWLQLERMFEVAEREFGEIDIVCPGAGVYEPVSATKGRGASRGLRDYDGNHHPSTDTVQHSTGATSGAHLARRPAKTRVTVADMPWWISTLHIPSARRSLQLRTS